MRESPTRRRILAALAATTSLAGCPSGPSTESTPTQNVPRQEIPTVTPAEQDPTAEIHMHSDVGGDEWVEKWTEEIIPSFETQSPATVRYTEGGLVRDPIRQLLDAGTPPELAHGTLFQHGRWIAQGETIPVDDVLDDIASANGDPHDETLIRTGGSVYIVPHGWSLGGKLNYREDIYERLGLSVPETWDELVENARIIDESEDVDARGFALPTAAREEERTDMDFTNWLYTAGGDYWRWADEDRASLEVAFRDEHVRAAIGMMERLTNYSPEPSPYPVSKLFQDWIRGDVAQGVNPNAWLAGLAYENGADDIALQTKQAPLPVREPGLDPPTLGWSAMEGTPIFTRSDNHRGARELLRFVHEGQERQAEMNLLHPTRWIPPYEGIMETETYTNADIFRAHDGHFLELNRRCVKEFAPYHRGDRPQTPAALYARSFTPAADLVRAVFVEESTLDGKIAETRKVLSDRLKEGREALQ